MAYSDGTHNKNGSGIRCVVIPPKGDMVERAIRLGFQASNNKVEYTIYALRTLRSLGAYRVELFTDSRLKANHFRGSSEARNEIMEAYLDILSKCVSQFT